MEEGMGIELEYAPTICPYCGCGCGIYAVIKEGKIVGLEPWKEHPVNEGANCPKGKNAHRFLYSEERLKRPLIRDNGSFKEVSWDEALSLIARKFKDAKPDSFGLLGSGKSTNEASYALQKFARIVMKTNNIEYCARFCHSATVAGLLPTVGGGVMQTSQLDIELADCIIIAGVNIQETFPMIARRVLRAKRKGATVIVIDPRKSATAATLADIHLQLALGTDVALINALMRIILDKGLEDTQFVAERTTGIDALRSFLNGLDLEETVKTTGVPLERIEKTAGAYAGAGVEKKGCILYDEGITQHVTGSDNVKVLATLALLTGNIGRPGTGVNSMRGQINGEGTGDMGCLNVFYPGFKRVGPETAEFFSGKWGVSGLPEKPGMPYTAILENCSALYVLGTNPMVAAPDTNTVRKMLQNKEFLVVQDIFMTETAELADVVLPACTWVEREGTHTWVDRRVQKIDKLIEPPGEAKPDWWIICAIAEMMGYKEKFDFKSAGEIFEEIRTCVPQYAGLTYERLKKAGGIQWPCPTESHPGTPTMFIAKFNTPDGLGHLQAVQFKPPAELPDEEYPFMLTTGRTIFHYHTGSMTRRTSPLNNEVPSGFVQINPEDATKLGITPGTKVTLRSRRGSVDTNVRITSQVPPGLFFVPFHFAESCANVLTNPALDPACKMPEFKVCAVNVEVTQ